MRVLWHISSESLQQEGSLDTGFILWECTDISGSFSSASIMQGVREGEDGGTGLDSEQSLLHEAVCPLCRAEVSWYDGKGCKQRN